MPTIELSFKQVVIYSQTIEVTSEEYELLKEHEGGDVENFRDEGRECYRIIEEKIDFQDIIDSEDMFTEIEIELIENP